MNCTLLDPSASIKMVLWENFINQVENNRTYMIHNVTVRKDKYYLFEHCKIWNENKAHNRDFTEVLAVPVT